MNIKMLGTGVLAYLIWGCFPLFFSLVAHIAPMEVISARVVWSFLFCLILVLGLGKLTTLKEALSVKALMWSGVAAILISTNWLIFVYAVSIGQVIQSSLGYFLTPLVSVFLARFILKEQIRPLQGVSIVLACIAVAFEIYRVGALPWISLLLASSFGLYGLVRKQAPFETLNGLFLETGWLIIPAIIFLAIIGGTGLNPIPQPTAEGLDFTNTYLMLSGIVTAVPLLLFSAAARQLPLTVIGFIMYINPTMQFFTAIYIFDEPFSGLQMVAFGLIWLAVIAFCYDLYQIQRKNKLTPVKS
ncbi:EamA family transporter RarD [Oceanospirillum sanctuarii]|uniref:EamA family transporter RarD n=1 Tax=Oceanospirillum sanctuarii TaxID=1434821 RepID=UPI000A379666|nr:EamA family transporter RarD [Oceanospirillum sanctuarii]